MRANSENFGYDVLPLGNKWWRHRWEYSFVEACIISLLCLIAAFWEKLALTFLRTKVDHVASLSPLFFAESNSNYETIVLLIWRRRFTETMVVQLFVLMTLWMFMRFGVFHLWVVFQFTVTRNIHLPVEAVVYIKLAWDVSIQLVFAMIVYYTLMLQVCVVASKNTRDCMRLECGLEDELAKHPIHPMMMGKFATSPAEYAALKNTWFELVAQRATLAASEEAMSRRRNRAKSEVNSVQNEQQHYQRVSDADQTLKTHRQDLVLQNLKQALAHALHHLKWLEHRNEIEKVS
jgi:hypothetical protein